MDSSASASASPPFASYGTQRGDNGNGITEAEGNRDTGRISSSSNLGYGYGNGNEMNLVGSRESGIPLTYPGQHRQGQGQEHGQRSGQTNYTHTTWGNGNQDETDQSRTDFPHAQGQPGSQAQFQDQAPSRPFPPDQKEQAYCSYCQIYKPWRSHHCRVCGVCVLGME